MTDTAGVRLLADAPEIIPTLAVWYKKQWAEWFVDTPLDEIEADFRDIANRDRMPLGFVAFDHASMPLGVCSIRAHPFDAYPDAGPWLRGLYVHTPYRGQGVADELLRAACAHAAQLQIAKLYAATHSAVSTFEAAGWLGFDRVLHEGERLTIFAKRTG
jgi:GNAT superfamily N-acetyltransferase